MTEWQILSDPVGIGLIHLDGSSEGTSAFWAFGGQQVALASSRTHHFACAGDFEPFGNRFACLNTFWASHIKLFLNSKMSAKYRAHPPCTQVFFQKTSFSGSARFCKGGSIFTHPARKSTPMSMIREQKFFYERVGVILEFLNSANFHPALVFN